jgi:hypothetical protein
MRFPSAVQPDIDLFYQGDPSVTLRAFLKARRDVRLAIR